MKNVLLHFVIPMVKVLCMGYMLLCMDGCRTVVPTVTEHITHDTLYLMHDRYDSISLYESSTERYHPSSFHYDSVSQIFYKVDTLVKETAKTEFRYKMLHDTTYIHKVDTIPKVITVKQPSGQNTYLTCALWLKILTALVLFLWLLSVLKNKFSP